jgi:hypothetical protein
MIKRKGIPVERNLNLKPSPQLPIHVSEYAPLSEPENANRLLGLLNLLQKQGLDIVMLDSAVFELHSVTNEA